MINSKLNLIAQRYAQGRLAFFLEGGYNLDVIGRGSRNLIEELAGSLITPYDDVYQEYDKSFQYTESLIDFLLENLEETLF